MYKANKPYSAYMQTEIQARAASATPHEHIRMLLDATLAELNKIAGHMDQANIKENKYHVKSKALEAKSLGVNKCLNIIHALDAMLDFEDKEHEQIIMDLHNYYVFCNQQLVVASVNNSTKELEPIAKIIGNIRDGWQNFK